MLCSVCLWVSKLSVSALASYSYLLAWNATTDVVRDLVTDEGDVNDETSEDEDDEPGEESDTQMGRADGHDDPKGARRSNKGKKSEPIHCSLTLRITAELI